MHYEKFEFDYFASLPIHVKVECRDGAPKIEGVYISAKRMVDGNQTIFKIKLPDEVIEALQPSIGMEVGFQAVLKCVTK
jgi:hypothetical protein